MTEKRTVLIAGPTGSGKSAAALAVAREFSGEIVNADALQVYRDLRILSARPTAEDEAAAPHRLYGEVDGAVRYSAGEWSRAARAAIVDIHARNAVAVIVGGTGLYFRVLEKGLAAAPEIPAGVRAAASARFDEIGAEAFRREVISFDPEMARLHPADRQRHVRAWEVFNASGETLSSIQARPAEPILDRIDARIVIEPTRDGAYLAVENRFDAMMAAGALGEARALRDRGLDPDLPVMKAVGAAELLSHLGGVLSLDDAIGLAKQNTRRFVKRQMTWFRHQTPDWPRAAAPDEAVAGLIAGFVASRSRGG